MQAAYYDAEGLMQAAWQDTQWLFWVAYMTLKD